MHAHAHTPHTHKPAHTSLPTAWWRLFLTWDQCAFTQVAWTLKPESSVTWLGEHTWVLFLPSFVADWVTDGGPMFLFSFIFLSLVSKSSVVWEGWSQDFLNQNQSASSKRWKCPDSFFSVLLYPLGDLPFTSPRAGEGSWDLLCPGDLASVRSWRSQAEVDWPSPREGHIMAAQPAGSFSTSLPPRQRHPHSPLGWWKCLWLRPWLCGWLTWKFWEIKYDSLKRARMHEASAKIGPLLMLGLLTALQALRGGRGNGIHFVPPWLPPTTSSLERAFLWKRLFQPSVSGLCFIVSPCSAAFLLPLPWQSTRFILLLCVSARLGV